MVTFSEFALLHFRVLFNYLHLAIALNLATINFVVVRTSWTNMLSCFATLVTIYIITFGFTIVAPLVISCEAKIDEGCYDANEMQKLKILLIFSGSKSRAVTAGERSA